MKAAGPTHEPPISPTVSSHSHAGHIRTWRHETPPLRFTPNWQQAGSLSVTINERERHT